MDNNTVPQWLIDAAEKEYPMLPTLEDYGTYDEYTHNEIVTIKRLEYIKGAMSMADDAVGFGEWLYTQKEYKRERVNVWRKLNTITFFDTADLYAIYKQQPPIS
jgi:hypothetical protein